MNEPQIPADELWKPSKKPMPHSFTPKFTVIKLRSGFNSITPINDILNEHSKTMPKPLHPCIKVYRYKILHNPIIGDLSKIIIERSKPFHPYQLWCIKHILKWEVKEI